MSSLFVGIAFDLDGVLFDTERVYDAATAAALEDLGYHPSMSLRSRLIGLTNEACVEVFKTEFGQDFSEVNYTDRYAIHKRRIIGDRDSLLRAGATETLQWGRSSGLLLIVVTNSLAESAKRRLAEVGVIQYFSAVIGPEGDDAPKPSPDTYVRAMSQVEGPASKWVAVEDSPVGARAAAAAGLYVVGMPDPSLGVTSLAPFSCVEISQLTQLCGVLSQFKLPSG